MLVLTRKPGEGIIIGDNIIIKIIEMKSGGIRIGIDAPRDTKIYRQEVYDRIRSEGGTVGFRNGNGAVAM